MSPKKFLQCITIEHAKSLLDKDHNIFDVSHDSGLSGSGRLHDLFINIEAMTPGEYKNGGEYLDIKCSQQESIFGSVNIATTEIGICHLSFSPADPLVEAADKFPNENFTKNISNYLSYNLPF